MVYNNDHNYAAIDYLATHRYYKLMRSSAGIININSSELRIKTDHRTSRGGNHLYEYIYYILIPGRPSSYHQPTHRTSCRTYPIYLLWFIQENIWHAQFICNWLINLCGVGYDLVNILIYFCTSEDQSLSWVGDTWECQGGGGAPWPSLNLAHILLCKLLLIAGWLKSTVVNTFGFVLKEAFHPLGSFIWWILHTDLSSILDAWYWWYVHLIKS